MALDPGQPQVLLGGGHRPEATTRVHMEAFDGPLALLLSLIEARQLDVLTVPLGGLAAGYLEALAGLDTDRIGNISSFVAIASQLILIKSRALLPRAPEPTASLPDEIADPEAELRARLLLYRAYRDAGNELQAMAVERIGLFRRESSVAQAAGLAGAAPSDSPSLDPGQLARALAGLAEIALPPAAPPEIVPRTITLTDRAAVIRAALRGADVIVLQDLLLGVRDKVVVAVTFLAMLELVKRREIVVEQAEPWGPITARRVTPSDGPSADATGSNGSNGSNGHDEPFDETLGSMA
jgi:segregation and condensation protein A